MSEVTRVFSVRRTPTLTARVPIGRLAISSGGAADEVTVHVRGPQADRFLIEQSGSDISVGMDHERRISSSHDVEVITPAGSELLLSTASADVTCDGVMGAVRITTAAGDLRVEEVVDLDAKTASGDVEIGTVGGRCRVRTASGDVQIGTARGDVSVVTAAGDVLAGEVRGDLTAKTASGRIGVERFSGAAASAKTIAGSVRITIPSGRTANVDLQSLTGDIAMPESRAGRDAGGPHVRVRVKTVSGDIAIRATDG